MHYTEKFIMMIQTHTSTGTCVSNSCMIEMGHIRFLLVSQIVHVTCLCRMPGADTTGRDGHVDTRPRGLR